MIFQAMQNQQSFQKESEFVRKMSALFFFKLLANDWRTDVNIQP